MMRSAVLPVCAIAFLVLLDTSSAFAPPLGGALRPLARRGVLSGARMQEAPQGRRGSVAPKTNLPRSPPPTPKAPKARKDAGEELLADVPARAEAMEAGGEAVQRPRSGTQWSLRSTEEASSPSHIDRRADGGLEPLSGATKALNNVLVTVLKGLIDAVYEGRDYSRFYVLETVARVPYFSYMSVLHLYETIGLHRKANWIKVHFAEADNELHHLLIMESLGGNKNFVDRFFAEHAAFGYYWMVVGLYMVNPRGAYHLSQLIEDHAYKTYDKFLNDNEEELKAAPAPQIALDYYMGTDYYMFDAFHTALSKAPRRPQISNLYDVFECIRDDEGEHRASLQQLVDVGQICSRFCTPSPACSVYADMCDVEQIPTARGKGTSYVSMKDLSP